MTTTIVSVLHSAWAPAEGLGAAGRAPPGISGAAPNQALQALQRTSQLVRFAPQLCRPLSLNVLRQTEHVTMADNPYVAPIPGLHRNDPVGLLLRVAVVIANCFLVLSCLLFMGMSFGTAFLTTFTVENGLGQPIWVTPVGTVGPNGSRHPLPVSHIFVVTIPSAVRGGYKLQPNETVTITYDMDDINFSEIVIENGAGVIGQLIVDANPTANQYHSPATTRFLVQDVSLAPVPAPVLQAANRARQRSHVGTVLMSILIIPWPAVILLSWLRKKHAASVAAQTQVAEPSHAPEHANVRF